MFKHNHEHIETTLGDIATFQKSYSFSREMEGEGFVRHIHYGDIHTKLPSVITNHGILPTIIENKDFQLISYGDILIADASEDYKDLGKAVCYLDDTENPVISGLHTHRFNIDNEKVIPEYLINIFQTHRYRKFVWRMGTGVSVLGLSKSNLEKFPIYFPSNDIQKKVAHFFNFINRKLYLQQEIIDLLKEQKKGYMQKLFKQELRFKEKNKVDYPAWKKIKLGKLTKKTGKKNSEGMRYPVAAISNKKGFTLEGEKNYSNADVDIKAYKLVHKNEFAYNPARINVGSFGFQNVADIAIVSSLYVIFKTLPTLSNAYLKAYMHSSYFNRDVIKNTEGSVREYLFYENFSNIKIPLPCIKEQEKIAEFLLKIDSKIQLEERKLESLQEQKKWFMQQMFI
ncbi:restriction endonuclease subunit S [Neobacillus kokaensis]|uniref:Restriction endonuclease n=1 Tax=Neobacillus kokaensis TaxID=2759023 RepID=A0ABQ3MW40_9BACI|nr:restriction endonuclease subunit S [Neobacillus kokaensis]GHH96647.1 restriction endonuclease [Neobacillus kokaensis]